ncbi:MAG: stage III sporulation protein AC [Clostridia bacterium]|nr:stage III sporulation protein AC [Clostridia bacterium]MBP3650809.1 stage III sporulation protein AC [Clostridia bacterium]
MTQLDVLFKLAGLGMVVAFISMVLKQAGREELGTLVTVVGLVIALLLAVNVISELFGNLKSVFSLY